MKEFIINQIAPGVNTILATAVTSIFVYIVKKIGSPITQLVATKKKEAEIKYKDTAYASNFAKAIEAWNIVDDKFRITENAMAIFGSKEKLFEQKMLERIPGVTQEEIDTLRDAVSGEINKGRKILTEDSAAQQLVVLQQDKAKLEAENVALRATITQINSATKLVTNDNAVQV